MAISPAMGRRNFITAAVGLSLLAFAACAPAAQAKRLPAPTNDATAASGLQTAYFAGGCFWGVQAVFAHVDGVKQSISGYAGGHFANPSYEQVSTGTTGHAESVKVTYDPKTVTYGQLLQIFFSVATDPTQLNMQYPDVGTQYRNVIFYVTPEQKKTAEQYIMQLTAAHAFDKPIVTKVQALNAFYPAESYHQDYLFKHPDAVYIATYDMPKLAELKTRFPETYADRPVRFAGL